MNLKFWLGLTAAMFWANGALAQSCENSWGFVPDGGFEADAPEAYSPCLGADSIGVLCIGPALMVTYSPAQGALPTDPNGGDYWPVSFDIGDFHYEDYAGFMGATGEFSFVRVAWDDRHPLFEALQSGARVDVSIPGFNIQGSVSLAGSRAAIAQVIAACQGN